MQRRHIKLLFMYLKKIFEHTRRRLVPLQGKARVLPRACSGGTAGQASLGWQWRWWWRRWTSSPVTEKRAWPPEKQQSVKYASEYQIVAKLKNDRRR